MLCLIFVNVLKFTKSRGGRGVWNLIFYLFNMHKFNFFNITKNLSWTFPPPPVICFFWLSLKIQEIEKHNNSKDIRFTKICWKTTLNTPLLPVICFFWCCDWLLFDVVIVFVGKLNLSSLKLIIVRRCHCFCILKWIKQTNHAGKGKAREIDHIDQLGT